MMGETQKLSGTIPRKVCRSSEPIRGEFPINNWPSLAMKHAFVEIFLTFNHFSQQDRTPWR